MTISSYEYKISDRLGINLFAPFPSGVKIDTIMCFEGTDGYRCVVTFSELFNRNDQQKFLLIRTKPEENGMLVRIFPASDFFSDKAIKSVCEIHLGF